jgi:membrane protein required for colicin V production
LTRVNGVDLVILIIVGFSAVMGLQRGFMLGMVDLLVFGFALIAGARLIDVLAGPLRDRGIPDPLAAGAGFVVAAVIAYAAVGLAVRIILSPLRTFGTGTPLAWVNSVLGLLPGVFRGLAMSALLIIALSAMPVEIGLRQQVNTSQLAEPLAISGREALNAGLEWAGVDPRTLGLPGLSLSPGSEG